jgi:Putative prokaryotic signal transducing protein
MICPSCKCEYIRGVTQCADCGVALVDALESPGANPADDVRIVSIWRGNDPAECERVQEALEHAEIPFTVPDSKSPFSFLPTEPTLEVWISDADRERARKILLDLEGRVDPDELTPEEIESLALPESNQPDREQTSDPQNLSENWYEDEPAVEAWNGDSEAFADSLIACLREVGIASHKLSGAGHWRLVVRPEQESRAKEVVREVVEAKPPE